MTVLVANFTSSKSGTTYPMATTAWAVVPNPDGQTCTIGQGILMAEAPAIQCTFDEFLALIADGGKIVDLRKLQSAETSGECDAN